MASDSTASPTLSFTPQQVLATPDKAKPPRERAIRACQTCRAKRIRCDNKRPTCSACQKKGSECVQVPADSSLALDPGSLKILQRIDLLEHTLKSFMHPGAASSTPLASSSEVVQARELCPTTADLLSWSVFRGQYDGRRDLKSLLRGTPPSQASISAASVDMSFLSDETESISCRRLLDRFFNFVHVKNPMLDEARVRQMVHRLSLEGPKWDSESCLALLVCAIGSLSSSFDALGSKQLDAQSTSTAQSYFAAAQRRISVISGNSGVLEAQCHFYSGVYLMTMLQPLHAWRSFVQALACCQEFTCANTAYNDHEMLTTAPRMGLPAEESVYWSCWKSERELRIHLDLPDFAFNNLSYPHLFPTPPPSMVEDQAVSWYFYLSEISLLRLEHRAREEINYVLRADGPSLVTDLANSTVTLEGFAEEWVKSLPLAMNLFTPQEEDDVLKFILRGHFLDLWEVIYWPWLDMLLNRQLAGSKVATYVMKGLQIGVDRIRINNPGFYHRHHGTWLMIQSCTRSALVLLAARHSAEGIRLVPDGWREAVCNVMELLRFWQHDAPDATDRIQILEELSISLTQ